MRGRELVVECRFREGVEDFASEFQVLMFRLWQIAGGRPLAGPRIELTLPSLGWHYVWLRKKVTAMGIRD